MTPKKTIRSDLHKQHAVQQTQLLEQNTKVPAAAGNQRSSQQLELYPQPNLTVLNSTVQREKTKIDLTKILNYSPPHQRWRKPKTGVSLRTFSTRRRFAVQYCSIAATVITRKSTLTVCGQKYYSARTNVPTKALVVLLKFFSKPAHNISSTPHPRGVGRRLRKLRGRRKARLADNRITRTRSGRFRRFHPYSTASTPPVDVWSSFPQSVVSFLLALQRLGEQRKSFWIGAFCMRSEQYPRLNQLFQFIIQLCT